MFFGCKYSEVLNRRAGQNKQAGLEKKSILSAFLLSKLINEQGGIFCLLHEKLRAGCKENLKNLSKHALLLGTSEYICNSKKTRLFLVANIYWSKSQGKTGDAIYGLPLKQHTNFWKNIKNAASKIKTINQQKNTPPWPDVCEVTITQLGEILCKLHS